MKRIQLYLPILATAVLIILLPVSCKECPTEPDYDIYLSVEDVACVWVTLKVNLPDSGRINTFALERNDSTVATYTCLDDDTLIFDEGLTPDTDYSYTVCFLKDGKTKAESDPVSVHTLPATSHDFTWEIETLGNWGSDLNDVWIVDENNIWVVGTIKTDSDEYNAARWDGNEWELMQIVNPDPIFSIFYFSDDDIWYVLYGYPVHWDGNDWTLYRFHSMGIDAHALSLWGTSSSNIYFVGDQGSIVHYDGSTFRKIGSGTEMNISDVYGFDDGTIFIQASSLSELTSNLIQVSGQDVRSVYSDDTYRNDIWGASPNSLWSVGEGIFQYNSQNQQMEEYAWPMGTPKWMLEVIDGNAVNNVFTGGHNSLVMHYDGQSWKHYSELLGYGIVTGIDVYQNMVAIVSVDGSNTYIIRGK
ncbi:MAG: hypothetical protein JXR87_00470 [Candidatus Marinimicrobia bacterium]|nr:hypothetical protein [Candidatus Neomarinimicrobiota bacterium]